MAALKWPLLVLALTALCSGHRATPMAAEPAPFLSEPNPAPGLPSSPQVLRLAPPKPPPEFNRAPAPTPARGPTPSSEDAPSLIGRSTPASGPPSSPDRPSATPAPSRAPSPADAPGHAPARSPTPAPYMESVPRPSSSPAPAGMSPAPFPPTTNYAGESNIAVNCCGAGWGSPGCGGTSCPGGGGAGCGASPCPPFPKNPYYCQPAGNQGYGCGSGGGFTIYMGDHFTSGDEKKS